eukprot:GHUV01043423.1.p1 GENE.GHUV01043423.1~~GHUV01043423.1.p1  ORF type:complete len:108 (+),score=8.52 GHUV01043423.1:168-491(+)
MDNSRLISCMSRLSLYACVSLTRLLGPALVTSPLAFQPGLWCTQQLKRYSHRYCNILAFETAPVCELVLLPADPCGVQDPRIMQHRCSSHSSPCAEVSWTCCTADAI